MSKYCIRLIFLFIMQNQLAHGQLINYQGKDYFIGANLAWNQFGSDVGIHYQWEALYDSVFFKNTLASSESANPPVNKIQAKTFLNRTAKVIISAQNALKNGKVYTDDFVLAVRHQRWAKKQYALNNFDKAIYHSGRARALALKAIRANKGPAPVEATLNTAERAEIGKGPSPSELDESVSKDHSHNQKDIDVLNTELDMTVQ
jgi:hypothetical protein